MGLVRSLDWLSRSVSEEGLRVLPIERRIECVGFLFDMAEAITASHSVKGLREVLRNALYEIMFLTKDTIVNDTEYDDMAILGSKNGSRNAILLYFATEHAYANDLVTTGHIVEEIAETAPYIASFLREDLAAAQDFRPQQRTIDRELSIANLRNSPLGAADSHEWREKAAKSQFELTVGVTAESAIRIFDEYGGQGRGKLLTVGDFATSGGSQRVNSTRRSREYNTLRKKVEHEQLGYEANLFLPQLTYGALNPASRPDKSNYYGELALHLKQREDVSYTVGDSLPMGGTNVVYRLRVNLPEARAAALYNESRRIGNKYPSERIGNIYTSEHVDYVEAQIPGVTLDDIEKISLSYRNAYGPKNFEVAIEALMSILRSGVEVSVEFWWSTSGMQKFLHNAPDGLTYGNQIRHAIDPSGTHWPQITVRMVDIVPEKLTQTEIVDTFSKQDIEVVYNSDPAYIQQ